MSKTFGEAVYSAYRQNGILHVRASGLKPTLQTIVTIEELPFLIYPPQLGLFFETNGIVNPVVLPFEIETAFAHYPASARTVQIVDRNGTHAIDIVDRPETAPVLLLADAAATQFVVYRQIGTDRYLIARAGAPVIDIYIKVFGPDSYSAAQAYVAAHTTHVSPTLQVVPGSLKAWIDRQPGVDNGSKLIVTVDAVVEVDWTVTLISAVPQGINPLIKLLRFEIYLPVGPVHSQALVTRTFRYEESPAQHPYTNATIENGPGSVSVPVENVS
ncbi:hypothetical protein [Tardiphaga sp. 42S5]|uniref:hypothetical protein n=1 Tax=Tardiphaga sp. 42S5 TaxID=1404799 RepID=UPI002A59B10A|nr:hypothetical protein [Tardiphaga sp. 42S5]WPO40617.1 hypothetical protein SFY93_24280 [Tardiphaga sp. 42S5]